MPERKNKIIRILLLLTATICLVHPDIAAKRHTPAQESKLAVGNWLKIRIDSTAVYTLPYDSLRVWGFEHPQQVKVFGYSGVQNTLQLQTAPDDLPQIPAIHREDAIWFFAEGPRRIRLSIDSDYEFISGFNVLNVEAKQDYYSQFSTYFLTDNPDIAPLTPQTAEAETPLEETATSYVIDYREPEVATTQPGGVFWHDRPLMPQGKDYTFVADGAEGSIVTGYDFMALAYASTKLMPDLPANITMLDQAPIYGSMTRCGEYIRYNLSNKSIIPYLPAGDNEREFRFHFSKPESVDWIALNSIYTYYRRKNDLTGRHQITLHIPSASEATAVKITTSNQQQCLVWDVTDPLNPALLPLTPTADGVMATPKIDPDRADLTLIAHHTSPTGNTLIPTLIGAIPNQNLHAAQPSTMVIITTDALYDQAMRIATLHRTHQGMDVYVYRQRQIFNEFGSGTQSPQAIRRFMQMLYERAPGKMKYLLMAGGGTYDVRGLLTDTPSGHEYLVHFEDEDMLTAKNETAHYATDMFFGILSSDLETNKDPIPVRLQSSNKSKADIAVGRLPAYSPQQLSILADKIELYLTDPSWAGQWDTALMMADQDNNYEHITKGSAIDQDIMLQYAPGATFYKIYCELFKQEGSTHPELKKVFRHAMAQGPRYFNYSGHTSLGHFGWTPSLYREEAAQMTYSSMPVMFAATCNSLLIDDPADQGILSAFLMQPRGGCIATIGAKTTAYMNLNHQFNQAFTHHMYTGSQADCLGDFYLRAYNDMICGEISSLRQNTMGYAFAGDPALPAYSATLGISTTETPAITAGHLTALSGIITAPDGQTATDFNGIITLRLFAPAQKRTLLHNSSADKDNVEVTVDQTELYRTTAQVVGGAFSIEINAPVFAEPSEDHRISLYAYELLGAKSRIATGHIAGIVTANATELPSLSDTTPPAITEFYIDSPQFASGDQTSSDIEIHFAASDTESGLLLGSGSMGARPSVKIDSKEIANCADLFRPGADGTVTLSHRVANLTDGLHTVSISISDCALNRAESSLQFVVNSAHEISDMTLAIDSTLIRQSVQFTLTGIVAPQHSLLIIEDTAGSNIASVENPSFPYTWHAPEHLASGICRAHLLVRHDGVYTATKPVEFTYIRQF